MPTLQLGQSGGSARQSTGESLGELAGGFVDVVAMGYDAYKAVTATSDYALAPNASISNPDTALILEAQFQTGKDVRFGNFAGSLGDAVKGFGRMLKGVHGALSGLSGCGGGGQMALVKR